jgi:tetrahydromethanopterin S-methyltransferase subunit G
MNTDPNEIQKLTERVEALEKQIFEWKIIYEQQKRGGLIGFAIFALVVIIIALSWR